MVVGVIGKQLTGRRLMQEQCSSTLAVWSDRCCLQRRIICSLLTLLTASSCCRCRCPPTRCWPSRKACRCSKRPPTMRVSLGPDSRRLDGRRCSKGACTTRVCCLHGVNHGKAADGAAAGGVAGGTWKQAAWRPQCYAPVQCKLAGAACCAEQHLADTPPPRHHSFFCPAGQLLELPASVLPRTADAWPVLDCVLLGVGPDGHIASLFPNRKETAATGG